MADPQRPSPVGAGLVSMLAAGGSSAIQTLTGREWFGPAQPLPPVAPRDYKTRILDYPFAVNLPTVPRHYEGVSFAQLRALADNFDILRLVIETRKDQVAKIPFSWRVKRQPGEKEIEFKERNRKNKTVAGPTEFFEKPDGRNFWQSWLRAFLEDLFVIDAVSIAPRLTRDGGIYAFDMIDGATVKVLIDAEGRTPAPPSAAYQQIIKGMPAINLTTSELLYAPRNMRTNHRYGYSQVEQIIISVNIGR
jgi:hypothetical protein